MTETPKDKTLTTIPKAPVLAGDRGLHFSDLESMYRFCNAVVNSGTFKDINTPEIALIRLQAGLELGLTPIWSLTNIMVTNGRPSVWGDALLGLVLARPDCEDVIETFEGEGDQLTAVCEVHRRGRQPIVRKFSVSDAKRAGLHGRNVHNAYPSRMLQMRARSWACRDAFADALRGLGVIEELRDIEPRTAAPEHLKPAIVLPDEVEEKPITEPVGGVTGMKLQDAKKGMRVVYIPDHANGDPKHPDSESGIISSVNNKYVFVRFGVSDVGLSCHPSTLKPL